MPRYRTTVRAYVSGVMLGEGVEFSSDAIPGRTWIPLDDDAVALVEKRDKVETPAPPPAPPARDDQGKRDTDIAAALDLLNEHDYVRTGPRAERPKCSAVENIVGYPVFTDEVDKAWDARPDAEQAPAV